MSHEEALQRGRVGVIDLFSMKRLAATQLGWEISYVADAAMQREERYSECQCS